MSGFFQGVSEHTLILAVIFSIAVLGMAVALVRTWLKHVYQARRDDLDAALKQQMIERGMSADEIVRVLQAPGKISREDLLAETVTYE